MSDHGGYRLYWARNTGALAPQALLEEIGLDYERVVLDLDKREHQGEQYRAINPLAQVPTLILPDGMVMTETAAMVLHLAGDFPEAHLMPEAGSAARNQFYRWLMFMATTLYTADLRYYYPDRHSTRADEKTAAAIREAGLADMERCFTRLDGLIGSGDYLLGSGFSALDIYLTMIVGWHPDISAVLAANAGIARMADRVISRPALSRIWSDNVPHWPR